MSSKLLWLINKVILNKKDGIDIDKYTQSRLENVIYFK
jgi:hypothetical protein